MESLTARSDMRIALFIDSENLVRAAETIGLPTDISPVIQRIKQFGQVQIRRSFGDLERNIRDGLERESVRRMLHRNLVMIEDVPFATARKNTADMRLVVEALTIAFQYPHIDCFAVVASDRDYVPLFNKLRELGKTIIGIGIDRENINPNYREACDILIYYESLFVTQPLASLSESETSMPQLTRTYYRLLRDAIKSLEDQGRKTVGANVAPMIRQLRSDFEPKLIGCETFKDFIQKAQDEGMIIVNWPPGPGDFVVALNSEYKGSLEEPIVIQRNVSPSDPDKAAAYYREVLQSKMRVPLPNRDIRRRILEGLSATYSELAQIGAVSLRDWSARTFEALLRSSSGIEQTSVFKILLTLYFARCFQCRQSDEQFNPAILAMACDESMWQQRLDIHFLRTLLHAVPRLTFHPEGVSLLLFDDKDHIQEAERLIDEACNR